MGINENFSENAKKNSGFEMEDLYLIGATLSQIKKIRTILNEVILTKKPCKITFDSWRFGLLLFPSGLMIPQTMEAIVQPMSENQEARK